MLPARHISTVSGALIALLLVAAPGRAQTPAIYEATAHGRILACFGEAYALVELIDVATQNLALINVELRRTPPRPAFAAGLVLTGTQIDQKQSLEIAERLVECTEGAARRAAPDATASYTATAVREEIDVALMMAEGFTSDYQMMAARLMPFFGESTDPAAKLAPIRGIGRFGEQLRTLLQQSRTAIDMVMTRSRVAP
ncbi:MAG: hypothetical protein ABL986_12070 [Vicinamibacterales bacterium]|mgnify:CR=1 FL=1